MRDKFGPSLKLLAPHEGGFVNHPQDPGGATMRGITQRVYDGYRRNLRMSTRSVRQLTDAEHDAIYRAQYWDAVQGDRLPAGVDYVVFDGGVNSGPSQSIKWLQRALRPHYRGAIDGIIGQATIAAFDAHPSDDQLIADICDQRRKFLRSLRTFKTFGKGWMRRVDDVQRQGQAWASGQDVVLAKTAPAEAAAPAVIEDAIKRPTKAIADAVSGAGIGTAAISQTIDQALQQLNPLAGASAFIGHLVAGLTVAGVLVTAAGIGVRWYQKRREAERADALDLPTAATSAALES